MSTQKLIWEEKYSVGVTEIDDQHKRMFTIINELLEAINSNTTGEHLGHIIDGLINYKKFHFATEEKYFKEFNYDETEQHIAKHHEFNDKLMAMKAEYPEYNLEFAFKLVDFLEDWLINHLMVVDQRYKECFKQHGLK
jgi:hemerythrin-like metal-binding protein